MPDRQTIFPAGASRSAWLRFTAALLGLALAFFLATFSNVLREEGNFWGMAFSASFALMLAGTIALTVVPYLARRVRLERVRYTVEYDVTREGIVYLGMALLIGIAALNTGNNLLFIVVAAMLSAVVVSGLGSLAALSGLRLDVSLPQHVFAGVPVRGRITLENRGWFPRFSVSVVPPETAKARRKWKLERTSFAFPPRRFGAAWFHVPDLAVRAEDATAVSHRIIDQPAYFPWIAAKSSATEEVQLAFARRGRYVQETFGLSTRFPFSFIRKTRRIGLERAVIVYPAVQPTPEVFELLPLITGEFAVFAPGRGNDLYLIREYMPGDPARHLDWKATARSGSLKIREFAREDERKLRIVFDNPPPGALTPQAYERAVSLAASFAWHFAEEDTELSFSTAGFPGGTDPADFLRYLATVEPASGPSILEQLPVEAAFNLVFTARARGSIPTSLWAGSYFVFLGEKQ